MNVCVFCGSGTGNKPIYGESARALGKLLAVEGHGLIYGGGNVGLMGILADEVLKHQGKVYGIIPSFLMEREVGHTGLTQLEVVDSMHMRKKRMADLSDAFIAMPGGWGTLDELAEILTWNQLSLIGEPIGLLNINNFFAPLIDQMRKMVDDGFLNEKNFIRMSISDSPKELLSLLSGRTLEQKTL